MKKLTLNKKEVKKLIYILDEYVFRVDTVLEDEEFEVVSKLLDFERGE